MAVVKSCSSMLAFNIGHCLAHCSVKPDVRRPWYTRTATVVQAVRRPWYDRVAAAIQAEESRKGHALPEGRGESGAEKAPHRRPEGSEDAGQTAALAFQDCPDEPCGKRDKVMSFHAL